MHRIVLLGASNLTLGFGRIARLAAERSGPGPYRLLAAAGYGRGYALASRVLARELPPIAGCGLWRALAKEPDLPTRALVADAGNDLAYGASVVDTAAAVGDCLDRLVGGGADCLLVLPPVAGIERLGAARFLALRSLLFPGRRFTLETIVDRLRRLSGELERLATAAGARSVELDPAWLGGDGIHIHSRQRSLAWQSLLAAWPAAAPAGALPARLRWRFLAAERARLLALSIDHRQPARRLFDGSTLSLY